MSHSCLEPATKKGQLLKLGGIWLVPDIWHKSECRGTTWWRAFETAWPSGNCGSKEKERADPRARPV